MSDPQIIASQMLSALGGHFQLRPDDTPGLLGDGTTANAVTVENGGDLVYFRPATSREIWQVIHRNANVPVSADYPVIVRRNDDGDWEVWRPDFNALARQEQMTLRYTGPHAGTHMLDDATALPSDPLWIYRRAIVELRGGPALDNTLRLYVQPGRLPWGTEYGGGYGAALTSYIPTGTQQRWITHYIGTDELIHIVAGTAHEPYEASSYPPDSAPDASVPIANVLMTAATTAPLAETEIYDTRINIGVLGNGLRTSELYASDGDPQVADAAADGTLSVGDIANGDTVNIDSETGQIALVGDAQIQQNLELPLIVGGGTATIAAFQGAPSIVLDTDGETFYGSFPMPMNWNGATNLYFTMAVANEIAETDGDDVSIDLQVRGYASGEEMGNAGQTVACTLNLTGGLEAINIVNDVTGAIAYDDGTYPIADYDRVVFRGTVNLGGAGECTGPLHIIAMWVTYTADRLGNPV